MGKKIQLAIALIVLAAAVLVAFYLFTQSRKIEVMEKNGSPGVEAEGNQTGEAEPRTLEDIANATQKKAPPKEAAPSDREQAKATNGGAGIEAGEAEPSGEEAAPAEEVSERRQARSMVTPRFVEDLADFVVSRYHPAGSVDNPDPPGETSIDFKSLNARYGLELIGLRHSSSSLRKAREEILTFVMDPEVIEVLYEQYADLFVDELVATAREAQKTFLDPKEERGLSSGQVAEMLRLNAAYLENVAQIFEVLGKDASMPEMIEAYLQAEKEAVHANFVLNQKQNEFAVLQKEMEGKEGRSERLKLRLKKLEAEKEEAAQAYKEAIQQRERVRQTLIQGIQDQTGDIGLETHEMLYIAEWVHRRITEGENSPAILVGSEVLDSLAGKLRRRAERLAAE